MTVDFNVHYLHGVFMHLVKDLQLVTLRRLLNVVAAQESRVVSILVKNRNKMLPVDALDLYSIQYVRELCDEHVSVAVNIGMFVIYAQVLNEAIKVMEASSNAEHAEELKRYVVDLFEEMTSRFLDDRLCEDKNKICISEKRKTCHTLLGSCPLRVLLGLANCKLKASYLQTNTIGDEIFSCVHNYMNIVTADALHEDPYCAGFTTPTKMLLNNIGYGKGNILQGLLTPFEVNPNAVSQLKESTYSGICLNDEMQMLLKFIIHTLMEIRYSRSSSTSAGIYTTMCNFIRNSCDICLSTPCENLLWGRVYAICFEGFDYTNEHLTELKKLILDRKDNGKIVISTSW